MRNTRGLRVYAITAWVWKFVALKPASLLVSKSVPDIDVPVLDNGRRDECQMLKRKPASSKCHHHHQQQGDRRCNCWQLHPHIHLPIMFPSLWRLVHAVPNISCYNYTKYFKVSIEVRFLNVALQIWQKLVKHLFALARDQCKHGLWSFFFF